MKRIMTVMLAVIYITTGTISVMAGEPENNDAQKKESVSDSVKVQTSENTDEDRPKENSWRYSNGELIPQEDDATSNARAVTMHGKRSMDNLLTVLENQSLVQRKKEWI